MADRSKRGLSATQSRSSGMKGAKPAGPSRRGGSAVRGTPGPKLPGEKEVRETTKTVGVKPLKVSREARTPIDPRAVDRRKQVFDDSKSG